MTVKSPGGLSLLSGAHQPCADLQFWLQPDHDVGRDLSVQTTDTPRLNVGNTCTRLDGSNSLRSAPRSLSGSSRSGRALWQRSSSALIFEPPHHRRILRC